MAVVYLDQGLLCFDVFGDLVEALGGDEAAIKKAAQVFPTVVWRATEAYPRHLKRAADSLKPAASLGLSPASFGAVPAAGLVPAAALAGQEAERESAERGAGWSVLGRFAAGALKEDDLAWLAWPGQAVSRAIQQNELLLPWLVSVRGAREYLAEHPDAAEVFEFRPGERGSAPGTGDFEEAFGQWEARAGAQLAGRSIGLAGNQLVEAAARAVWENAARGAGEAVAEDPYREDRLRFGVLHDVLRKAGPYRVPGSRARAALGALGELGWGFTGVAGGGKAGPREGLLRQVGKRVANQQCGQVTAGAVDWALNLKEMRDAGRSGPREVAYAATELIQHGRPPGGGEDPRPSLVIELPEGELRVLQELSEKKAGPAAKRAAVVARLVLAGQRVLAEQRVTLIVSETALLITALTVAMELANHLDHGVYVEAAQADNATVGEVGNPIKVCPGGWS